MNNAEAKRAWWNEQPVIHKDIVYKCISELIYHKDNGRAVLSLLLVDKTAAHSVTRAPANEVREYIKE